MNKRKEIKLLKAENKLAYKTLDAYLDQLVAIGQAMNPTRPLITMNCSNTVQQVTDLVQENKRLLAQAHKDHRALSIGRAVERAAELLPDRMCVVIDLERYSGAVYLSVRGSIIPEEFHGDTLSEDINAAIDYAIASAENQEQQA